MKIGMNLEAWSVHVEGYCLLTAPDIDVVICHSKINIIDANRESKLHLNKTEWVSEQT